MSNWQPKEGSYSDSTYLMFSKTCSQTYKFICELEEPGIVSIFSAG